MNEEQDAVERRQWPTDARLELMEQRLTILFERRFSELGAQLQKDKQELDFMDRTLGARQDALSAQIDSVIAQVKVEAEARAKSVLELEAKLADELKARDREKAEWRDRVWRGVLLPLALIIAIAVLGLAFGARP